MFQSMVVANSSKTNPSSSFLSPPMHVESSNPVIMVKPPVLSCFTLQGPRAQLPAIYQGQPRPTAENTASIVRLQPNGFLQNGNGTYRFSQPGTVQNGGGGRTLSFAAPLFPLRNRTNMSTSGTQNFLLQTILKDSQKIKAEYQQYKGETQTKLTEQNDTILRLKRSVDLSQKKMLEMKLQKEVYLARECHAFQELQDDIHNLLQKVSSFAQAESLKLKALSSPLSSPGNVESSCGLWYADIGDKMRTFENKISVLEGKNEEALSTFKVSERNLKASMATMSEKLDQIMSCIIDKRGSRLTSDQSRVAGETDNSFYNASAEDSDACDHSNPIAHESKHETESGGNLVFEVPTNPIQITLKSPTNKNEIECRKRKSQSSCRSKSLRKRLSLKRRRRDVCTIVANANPVKLEQNPQTEEKKCNDDGDSKDNDELPPVLSLPCRIAKQFQHRSHSMPILSPEGVPSPQKVELKVNLQQESKKDDALIGIKRENFSNAIHGKDFTKLGFVCLCGARFTGAGGLYVHQVKTMENEKFSCRSCGKKFHYFSGLKAHRKSAHKQDFTQEVGCSRCGQIFKSKRDRQGHLDERGQTCWLSGSYQSKDWEAIRSKRNLSSSFSYTSSSASSSQNVHSQH